MGIPLHEIQPRFLYLDPASGKKKNVLKGVRARSAIVVIGIDSLHRIFVLDAWADRAGTNKIVEQFCDMTEIWGPQICGFEDVGQQTLLVDPILTEARKRGIQIPLTPVGVTTKVEKNARIRYLLQPVIGSGRLIIRSDLVELVDEITSFPMNAMKDMIDALATAISLAPPPTPAQSGSDDAVELARYLRESGASVHEIESRMEEIGGYGYDKPDNVWGTLTKLGNIIERG